MAKGSRGGKREGGFVSKDGSISYKKETEVTVTHYLYGSASARGGKRFSKEVLEAKTDGNGNVSFDYAQPKSSSGHSKTATTEMVNFKVGAGAINGSTFGINWSKVNSISGQTYNLRNEAKRNGLKWDNGIKMWRR